MTDEEIEGYRNRLSELTKQCLDGKQEAKIQKELLKLAREVGASTRVFYVHTSGRIINEADTSELIRNIHQALQTASMANMCRTATGGYKMATQASEGARRQFRTTVIIAIISAIAAWIAGAAAWVAAIRN